MRITRWMTVAPIYLYRWFISPLFPAVCNYHPSCSQYAIGAITRHGVGKGVVMAALRIGRCSSRYHGGSDPVPDVYDWNALRAEYRERRVRR